MKKKKRIRKSRRSQKKRSEFLDPDLFVNFQPLGGVELDSEYLHDPHFL